MSKLTHAIEENGKYCKVHVRNGEVTGVLVSEDHQYDPKTNTGGRKFIGYKTELEREYGFIKTTRNQ